VRSSRISSATPQIVAHSDYLTRQNADGSRLQASAAGGWIDYLWLPRRSRRIGVRKLSNNHDYFDVDQKKTASNGTVACEGNGVLW
jgi:hypothetical protein